MLRKVRITSVPKARTGYQVNGGLANDVPAMGGGDYNSGIGQPNQRVSKTLTAVPRKEANLEAEGGETVIGNLDGSGMPSFKTIEGPRHSSGGVPLSLPDDSFIFSDTKAMKITDPEILKMFGVKSKKGGYTPAELSKKFDLQEYRSVLQNPDSDKIDVKTAELMIKKYTLKLGALALAQESKKAFPQGIPEIAKPYMEANGITEEDLMPQTEQQQNPQEEMMGQEYEQNPQEEMMEAPMQMPNGQPIAMAQEMEQMSPEMMMHGGMRRLRRAQEGMQQASPEEMAMMEQQGGGQDEMMQIVQEVQSALQEGAEPTEVVMSLLQNGIPPEVIVQVFTQMGASQEEAVGLIQEVMSQGQGGQEQGMGQQPMSEEEAMMMQQQQQAPPMAKKGLSIEDPIVLSKKDARRMLKGKPVNMLHYPTKYNQPHDSHVYSVNTLKTTDGTDGYSRDNTKTSVIDNVFPDGTTNTQYQGRLNGKYYYYNTDDDFARLNEEKIPINTKLNESIASGAGYVPNKRFGGTSMAMYGMQMGGYDMPFYDDPNEMAYGGSPELISKRKESIVRYDTGGEKKTKDKLTAEDKKIIEEKWNGKVNDYISYVNSKKSITGNTKLIDAMYVQYKKNIADKNYYTQGKSNAQIYTRFQPELAKMTKQQMVEQLLAQEERNARLAAYGLDPAKTDQRISQKNKDSRTNQQALDLISKTPGLSDLDFTKGYQGQAAYIAYRNTLDKPEFKPYGQFQVGVGDETIGGIKGAISGIDNANTNTTLGQRLGYTEPTEAVEQDEYTCECLLSDGTKYDPGQDADGNCLECEEVMTNNEDPALNAPDRASPAWWAQDQIALAGALGDLWSTKKYMPWEARVDLQEPTPTYLDPTRELAKQSEDAAMAYNASTQFSGPQALGARTSAIQGEGAKQAANTLSAYNNANIGIANQFENAGVGIRNQENAMNQAMATRVFDKNTFANQQYDNSKRAARSNARQALSTGITNKWKTDAMNQMYPNYQVDPRSGGRVYYNPTDKKVDKSAEEMDMFTFADEISGYSPEIQKMFLEQKYGKSKKGGQVFEHGGFVYSVFPTDSL